MKNLFYKSIILFLVTTKSFSQADIQVKNTTERLGFSGNNLRNGNEVVSTDPVILSLGCSTAIISPKIATKGIAYEGTAKVLYTDGNGNSFGEFSAESTGVIGLTATLSAGTLVSGDENFEFRISGTPKSAGTASFLLSIAQVSCTMTLKVKAMAR